MQALSSKAITASLALIAGLTVSQSAIAQDRSSEAKPAEVPANQSEQADAQASEKPGTGSLAANAQGAKDAETPQSSDAPEASTPQNEAPRRADLSPAPQAAEIARERPRDGGPVNPR